jgi:hypothetical protein
MPGIERLAAAGQMQPTGQQPVFSVYPIAQAHVAGIEFRAYC